MTKKTNMQTEKGFSLLELLVAMLLIALGIIGMVALQSRALQYSSAAFYQGMGMQVANGLAANVRANPDGKDQYNFSATYSPTAAITVPGSTCEGGSSVTCSATQVAQADIYWARRSVRQLLPGGDIFMKHNNGYIEMTLVWEGAKTQDGVVLDCSGTGISTGSAENPQCLTLKVRV